MADFTWTNENLTIYLNTTMNTDKWTKDDDSKYPHMITAKHENGLVVTYNVFHKNWLISTNFVNNISGLAVSGTEDKCPAELVEELIGKIEEEINKLTKLCKM